MTPDVTAATTVAVLIDARQRAFFGPLAAEVKASEDPNACAPVPKATIALLRDCQQCRNRCLYLLSPWQGWEVFWGHMRYRLIDLPLKHELLQHGQALAEGHPHQDSADPLLWAP